MEWDSLGEVRQKIVIEKTVQKLCVIQNVSFDYSIIKKYGGVMEKVWDTMLAEQILNNGYSSEQGFNGLQAIYLRRFSLDISKDEQTSFGEGNPLTDAQIEYAAVDVLKLCSLRRIQIKEMKYFDKSIYGGKSNKGLLKTAWWEMEFVKCVADMEMQGVRFDKDKWYAISDSVMPIYHKELDTLNSKVKDEFWEVLVDNNWVSDKDEIITNVWTSSAKKATVLTELFDFDVLKTSKAELKKLLQDNDPNFPEGLKLTGRSWLSSEYPTSFTSKFSVIKLLILSNKDNKDQIHQALNTFLIQNMNKFCVDKGWLRPANKVFMNWGSPTQRLKIFQSINPEIDSTAADVLSDYESENSIITHYLGWSAVDYQLKNFGKGFYDKHVELDGKHRTRFQQILKTGRLSSVKPNLLNIPRKVEAYRAALVPDPGYDLIDADYDGQELVVVAYLAQETSWLEYLKKGYDLHSKNAELIFGDEWVAATERDCTYYGDGITPAPYKKCNCKVHKEMRDNSKAVSFGSIYGISYFKLAFNLKISEERAKFILKRFFEICPNIKAMMDRFGTYALREGHIIEPVFGRMRFFDKWKLAVPKEHGSIMRAAFNTPIQSSGSALLKIAFVLLRRWINHNNLQDHVQLLLPYHDETLAQSKPEYTELTCRKVEHYMMLAAKLSGFKVGAGAASGKSWLEVH